MEEGKIDAILNYPSLLRETEGRMGGGNSRLESSNVYRKSKNEVRINRRPVALLTGEIEERENSGVKFWKMKGKS